MNILSNYTINTTIIRIVTIIALITCLTKTSKADQQIILDEYQSEHQIIVQELLIAEIAADRGLYEQALNAYFNAAKITLDPEIASLATEYAIELKDLAKAQESVKIWAQNDPKDLRAQLIALTILINNDQNIAKLALENIVQHNPQDLEEGILNILSKTSMDNREQLTDLILDIAKKSSNPILLTTAASVCAHQAQIEQAEKFIQQALKTDISYTNAIQLQAKIIGHKTQNNQKALDYLSNQVHKLPENSELRLFYTAALTENEQHQQAHKQLEILAKDKVFFSEANIQIAEIAISNKNYEKAKSALNKAITDPKMQDKATFLLGQLAEHENQDKQAINWYLKVLEESEYHAEAFLRAAFLHTINKEYTQALDVLHSTKPKTFNEQKQVLLTEIDILLESKEYDKALHSTNEALSVLAEDVDFLYARSIVNTYTHNYIAAEKDLRLIITKVPNNANALNALGYALLNQPKKINEAAQYLEKALTIMPNNPAFMDSMGWLLYKQGSYEKAAKILADAYQLSQNSEIAIHFGEALWASGSKADARAVWHNAYKLEPNNKSLEEVIQKYARPLSSSN